MALSIQQEIERLAFEAGQERAVTAGAVTTAPSNEGTRFPALLWTGVALALAQILLLFVLRDMSIPEGAAIRSGPPARFANRQDCASVAYGAYRGVVAHMREHGQPPAALADLVGVYIDEVPVDPKSGKPLVYQSNGLHFSIGCP